MAETIDSLQIEINAKATKANDAIDRLVGKLDRLTTSLSRVNGTNLNGLANGVQRLGNAMQVMNTIKTADFTRLATNLTRLGSINVSALNSAASSMSHLARAMSAFSGTSFDNKNVQNLINSITRLSNANVGSLASADFSRLGISINQLATSLSNAPKIQQSVISMTNAIANLSKSGQNIPIAASSLGSLGQSMNAFMASVSSAPNVSENVISFAQAVGLLANSGAKAGITAKNLSALGVGLNNLMATLSRSPQVSQNVIQMTNALANLASQGSKVGSASNSIVRGLNKTATATKKAGGGFKGLASYMGKFYATYFMVIRGIKKLWSSIESTADYIEAYNYFNVALGKIGSDWSYQFEKYGYENAESYAESFKTRLSESLGKLSGLQVSIGADGKGLLTESGMKNLGLNIQEIAQYASQLASVTNSVGQTGETSLAIAKNFTRLAGDISSLFNVDYSSVSKNLQSGLIGQSRALYKYGIDITNATLQTYAYNLGLSKSVSEMTQAEKMQLRMLAILDQSKVSWGDLANTINSPSNMIRQFKNNLKETGMVLGQLFIPVLQKVLPVINGVAIAIKRLLVNIANLLGIKIDFDAFGQGYSNMEDDIDGITDSYEEAAKAAEEYKNQLLGFDEVNKLSEPSDSGSDVGTGGIDLTQQIIDAASEYEKAWNQAFDRMENLATDWADKIEKAIKKGDWYGIGTYAGKQINKGINAVPWKKTGEAITTAICKTLDFADGFISSVDWEQLGKDIIKFIEGIDLGKIAVKVSDLTIDLALSAIKLLWGAYQEIYDKWGIAGILASLIVPGGVVTIKFITEFSASIEDSKYVKKAKDAVENIKLAVQEKWDEITDWWNNTAIVNWWNNDVKPWFTKEKWENLADGIKKGIQGKWNDIVDWWNSKPSLQRISVAIEDFKTKIQNAWNSFKQWWDGLGLEFPHIDTPHFKIEGEFSFAPPRVPKVSIDWYANGGFPDKGQLFVANEVGPEMVGTMDGRTAVANQQEITTGIANAVYPAVYNAVVAAMSKANNNVNITLQGDADGLFKVVQNKANNYTTQTGRPAFMV